MGGVVVDRVVGRGRVVGVVGGFEVFVCVLNGLVVDGGFVGGVWSGLVGGELVWFVLVVGGGGGFLDFVVGPVVG